MKSKRINPKAKPIKQIPNHNCHGLQLRIRGTVANDVYMISISSAILCDRILTMQTIIGINNFFVNVVLYLSLDLMQIFNKALKTCPRFDCEDILCNYFDTIFDEN